MHPRFVVLATVMGVLGTLVGARDAGADEHGIVGHKLVIIDKLEASGKAKVVFVAKDATPGAIHKGPAADPPGLSGSVSIFPLSDLTGNRGEFALDDGPAGAWLVNKDTVAKYVNKDAAVGALGVKVAVVKPDTVLKVVTKNLGDGDAASGDDSGTDLHPGDVTASDTMRVVVALTKHEGNGVFTTHRMCADFVDLVVAPIGGGTGTKIVSKTSVAPADCDGVPSTTSTTIAPASCDVFDQNCPSGFGCYPTGGVPAAQCAPQGTGGAGNSCSLSTHCQAGLICVTAGSSTCRVICEVGQPSPCPGGTSCTALLGSNIPFLGVCL